MSIARDGWVFIALGAAVALGGLAGGLMSKPPVSCVAFSAAVLGVLFGGFCCYFFRDPVRPLPTDLSKIYSPGDGIVLSVAREEEGEGKTIRIFLSIFNVHIQRLPVSGTVSEVRYEKGGFAMAMKSHAKGNERNIVRVAVDGRTEEIAFEQIAGLVARRIRCWIGKGDQAVAGERYGLIRFGSQVAVHLPPGAESLVQPGDKATAGITPIAKWIQAG